MSADQPDRVVSGESEERERPPLRPCTWTDLPFTPAKPTQWFAPKTLKETGSRVLISSAFGAFLDKRELQNAVEMDGPPKRSDPVDGVWLDFIADTGDGFDPTYTVAWLASQPELRLSNHEPLRRPGIVVLGGDEVYPVGSPKAYQDKFWGPYQAALPWVDGEPPTLYALPGNHDWYDGLTNFFRFFCQDQNLGGRRTCQKRSYFSIQLQENWWIWGIDIQLDSYIDQPQQDYFKRVPLHGGDKVILCTATPSWYDGPGHQGYNNLRHFEDKFINIHDARVVLSLSGDAHHYAHYSNAADGTHKITAGGGGAFLHDTHTLKDPLPFDKRREGQTFNQEACYPSAGESRSLALRALALPWRNPTFTVLPAVIYVLVAWSSQFAVHAFGEPRPGSAPVEPSSWLDLPFEVVRSPTSLLILTVVGVALYGFAEPPEGVGGRSFGWVAKLAMALAHLALHVIAIVGIGYLAAHVTSRVWGGDWQFTVQLLILMAVLGGIVGGLATGLYLSFCCRWLTTHGNEAFSAIRNEGYKNFLRLHLDATGVLTVHPIGIDKANSEWAFDPDKAPDASWIEPAGSPPVAHLIEKPFQIG